MPRLIILMVLVLTPLTAVLVFTSYPRQVHGMVSDRVDGYSVAGAAILASERWVYSDRAGRYALGWIHGALTVTVQADGYLLATEAVPRGKLPVQTVSLPLALTPNALSGTVCDAETGEPLAGSVVTGGELSSTADERGHYTLQRLKIGTPCSAAMPGYTTSTVVFHGQQVQDLLLQPTTTRIQILDLYSGQPVVGSQIVYSSIPFPTDGDGVVSIKRLRKGSTLSIQAPGYAAVELLHDGSDTVSVPLRPNRLQGVVRDRSTGNPIMAAEVAAFSEGEVVTSSITGADGRFTLLDLPSPITLMVAAADYDRREILVGSVTEMEVYLDRFQVKGIYVPLGLLTNEKRVLELIDLVDHTELNAVVVDVKNDRGWLAYPSTLVQAQRAGAYNAKVMDIAKFLTLCREKDIYTIARLVVFKDPTLAAAYPEWAVRSGDGEVWMDAEGSSWGDPFRTEVQDYNIAVAKEVALLGFDELQFDYLRFPSDGAIGEIKYTRENTLESRTQTIKDFCARLDRELEPHAVLLSADLFGLTVWVSPEEDMGIGQRVVDIAPYMDYLSPMLYPATFTSGNLGYGEPLLYPYEVVYRSCVELAKRTKTRVRPWLQHYSARGVSYGVKEMHLQKKAADDAQTYGWMFWHAAGKYDEQSFAPVKAENSS